MGENADDSFDQRFLGQGGSRPAESAENNNNPPWMEMFLQLGDSVRKSIEEMKAQIGFVRGAEEADDAEEAGDHVQPDDNVEALQNQLLDEASRGLNPGGAPPTADGGTDQLLDELVKQAELSNIVDTEVDVRVASIVNALFRKKLDKDLFKELTSGVLGARPMNCEGLSPVQTNNMLWAHFFDRTKIADKKLQNQHKAIVCARAIMTRIFDKLVAAKGKPEVLQIPDLINHTNKSLMLLGDANFNINMFRRNLMKPELKDQYKKLCAENIPFTAELFGEDLPKLAKDIGETAKISNQLKAPNKFQAAGRGRGQDQRKNYRYEPYNYSRFQSRRGGNQSSYSSHSNNRNPPKRNFHPRQNDKSKP